MTTQDLTDEYIAACVDIGDDIGAECKRLGADMGRWAQEAADAEEVFIIAKANLKIVFAEMSGVARAMLAAEGKKPTDAAVEAAAWTSSAVREAHETYAAAARRRIRARGLLGAIEGKRDMLINMGATYRSELGNVDTVIRRSSLPADDSDSWDDDQD